MKNLFMRLFAKLESEKGQGMVEYALIIGLVAIVLIGALQLIAGGEEGGGISGIFTKITDTLGGVE